MRHQWIGVLMIFCWMTEYIARLVLKLRSECSALFGSQLRYFGIKFNDRTCPLCSVEPETSIHFCGSCSALTQLRNEFLSNLESLFPSAIPQLSPMEITFLLLQAIPKSNLSNLISLNNNSHNLHLKLCNSNRNINKRTSIYVYFISLLPRLAAPNTNNCSFVI